MFKMLCKTGTFVLLWRRGSSVLTAGHLKITRDERFKIVDDYNLQISNVKTQDAGDYICQIGDQETRDQVHTVEILGEFKCLNYGWQSIVAKQSTKCIQIIYLHLKWLKRFTLC